MIIVFFCATEQHASAQSVALDSARWLGREFRYWVGDPMMHGPNGECIAGYTDEERLLVFFSDHGCQEFIFVDRGSGLLRIRQPGNCESLQGDTAAVLTGTWSWANDVAKYTFPIAAGSWCVRRDATIDPTGYIYPAPSQRCCSLTRTMTGTRRTIFLFSMEPWGDMWYSKHHYANRLAQDHTVYFVGLPDRWRIKDLFSFGVKVKETKEGVRVVEYRNNLPLRFLPNRLARIVSWFNGLKLKRLYPKEPVILWTYFPARLLAVDTLRRKGDKLVYHVVDPFQVLPSDTDVARKADLVVAINSWFLSYYRNINANCVVIGAMGTPMIEERMAKDPERAKRILEKKGCVPS